MSSSEDNTISEMSLSIRQRLGETLKNKFAKKQAGGQVNDVGLSNESQAVDPEQEDSDT